MKILLTGGNGYIGSHTALALDKEGHETVIFDNLSNSHGSVQQHLRQLSRNAPVFYEGDVNNYDLLCQVLEKERVDAVIHLAGLKSVADSVANPVSYYHNNVAGTICLLRAMRAKGVKCLVFSSSATIYGSPQYLPLDEKHPLQAINPYGQTKLQTEQILSDLCLSDPSWKVISLRYFNPVGAHESGLLGENPKGTPTNLFPYITRVAAGLLPELSVYGGTYKTVDGTGVRDYLHVEDLARGHGAALSFLGNAQSGYFRFNLGTGQGYSVLQVLNAFAKVVGTPIPYKITEARGGDVAECYADATQAAKILGWNASRTLTDMCKSAWDFQRKVGRQQ